MVNKPIDPLFLADTLRIFFYIITIVESSWLLGLYLIAWAKMKKTLVIKGIMLYIFANTISLIFMFCVAFMGTANDYKFDILRRFLLVPLILQLSAIINFRIQSLSEFPKKEDGK